MANLPSEITAKTVEETICISLPIDVMDDWLRKYRTWQNFVLNTYSYRFQELLNTVDSIAFLQLDERLLKYLQEKADLAEDNVITTTHQQIADDLNSSREVISRLLKQLEKRGMITLGRNKVIMNS
jgi:CRP/FNR family transcriptional regulator